MAELERRLCGGDAYASLALAGHERARCQALCLLDEAFLRGHPEACALARRMLHFANSLPALSARAAGVAGIITAEGPAALGAAGGAAYGAAVSPHDRAYVWSMDLHVAPFACDAPLLEELGAAVHAEVDFANCAHYPR